MVKIISVIFIIFFIFILSVKADEKVNDPIADLITNTTDEEFIKIAFTKKDIPKKDIDNIKQHVVSFSGDNVPLKMVLYAILKGTPYNVIFAPDVDSNKAITLNFKGINLKDALETIMDVAGLSYEVRDKVIYVKGTITKIYKLPYIKTVTSYNSSLGGNVTGGQRGGAGGGVGTGGGGTTGTGGTTTAGGGINGEFQVDYSIDQNDLFAQIEDNIKNILSKNGKYALNKTTGVLVVEDTKDRVKLVEEYLARLKREIDKQVLIEAKILEVSLSDSYSFGVDWSKIIMYPSVVYSQTLSLSNSVASLAVLRNGDIKGVLNAIATFGDIKTLSNPRVLVLNNQPAILTSGRIIPFWTKQLNIVGANIGGTTTTAYPVATYTRRDILDGITLGVTPHIEDDGDIILNIVPISTSIIDTKKLIDGGQVVGEAPILAVKETGTIVRAKSGDIIIIGGLLDKGESDTETKVPVLGDIPVIGNLFKQKTVSKSRKELIIFMKVEKVERF
ncbi:secretin and TonB N-terminal domain-containing protein [Sulfurihydrogenibium sp.]|jgi:MSHA biogenesis protein MshL|uniref:secretin and TonB N-terminal domain-containing protein n=1 Tax=Sulfurihydrogenibium sp. TaxID=2053621 RepID=UPI002604D2F4|nr:secretin and TonB N-terminal domain-containing protein [Sulfurihydrogenibium sp.]